MTMMMIMTKRKEQVQNLIPRLDRNLSRSALTNDYEEGDDDVEDGGGEGEGGDEGGCGDVDGRAGAVMKVPVVDMIYFV